ncbi:MAG: 30S ribosomal protein S2, partial [Patescibacteria group bacterium]|nr:30S ribosomal protein S2 [Patescibacteria group bacterium]
MSDITLEELLKSGAHFGHKASRWNPKMAPYIFTVRNKFHIIDLEKTHAKIKEAQKFVKDTVKSGGTVLFVGTKRQARATVK